MKFKREKSVEIGNFVVDVAKESKNVMDFEERLKEKGSNLTPDLIPTLYALITKMMPEWYELKNIRTHKKLETNSEEIDLSLSDSSSSKEDVKPIRSRKRSDSRDLPRRRGGSPGRDRRRLRSRSRSPGPYRSRSRSSERRRARNPFKLD